MTLKDVFVFSRVYIKRIIILTEVGICNFPVVYFCIVVSVAFGCIFELYRKHAD